MKKEIVSNASQIAYCGLYCGSCGAFLKEKCKGCSANEKATWCSIRNCCIEHNSKSCADCTQFSNVKQCKKFNNFIGRAFGFIFRSNRPACITFIKEKGYQSFADYMAENKLSTIKR
jgi:hypothetical protein